MKFSIVLGYLILGTLSLIQLSTAVSCTIGVYNEDDIKNAEKNCSEIILNSINVPGGITLNLNLTRGTKLIFQGVTTWGFYEWNGPLVNITGADIEITGAPRHVLDAKGNLWWDNLGEAGGKIKPVFFVVHGLKNSRLHNITVKNTPFHAFWIEDSDGVIAEDFHIDSSDGDTMGGNNTDGFNVWRSNNVTIQRINVYNQDDCVAIKSGTNIVVNDSYCSGGHGLSIGSVGGRDYNIVENVLISNSEVINADNGVRIKTVKGANGSVTNVTYENIALKDINKFGIRIHDNYTLHTANPADTDGSLPIKEIYLKNVTGTVKRDGINILISVKNASDWHWSGVNITGGEKTASCEGIPEDSGISC